MTGEDVRVEFMIACRHDSADLANLARRRMPEMKSLHADEGWRTHYRFGPGFHPEDSYLMIARLGGDGPLLGFAWADAATRADADVVEPWWCINAVAVDDRVAGKGLGHQMVSMLKDQAEAIGITSLYGLCYPESAGFWRKQGFMVGDLGQNLTASAPALTVKGQRARFHMDVEPGNHFFTLVLGDPADGLSRLILEEYGPEP